MKSKEKMSVVSENKSECSRGGAFTLVELMIVVAVIGVIAGIVIAVAGGAQKKAARDQTKAEIKTILVALERYRSANGFYPVPIANPSSTALFVNLTNFMTFRANQLSGSGTNLVVLDPYGYPYWYRLVTSATGSASSTNNLMGETVEVWSTGPNGKSGFTNTSLTAPNRTDTNNLDDIVSWN